MDVKMKELDGEFISRLFSKTISGLPLQRKMDVARGGY